MKIFLSLFVLLLTACASDAQVAQYSTMQAATATAQVIHATSTATARVISATQTQAAWQVQATGTTVAQDAIILAGIAAQTQQAGSVQATQDARQATQSAATASAQAVTATAEAAQTATAAVRAQRTEAARSLLETQAAQSTATLQALAVSGTQDALSSARLARQATQTADAEMFALQLQDINLQRSVQSTRVALDLQRMEVTNNALAVSPYIIGSLLLGLLIWLAWRFGQVESNRRKRIDDLVIDERGGALNVLVPGRSFDPALVSSKAGVVIRQVAPELQAQVTQRDQAIAALKAAGGTSSQAARLMDAEPSAPVTIREIHAPPDWAEIGSRKAGLLLLGSGETGQVTARQDTPHVLLAGQTGSGKSTAMRSIITQHLLDGRRVTVLDKSGRDYGVFGAWATVITIDAGDPGAAINRLVSYMRSAWQEVLRRQHEAKPAWRGIIDVLVVDELDNWQDISQDADTSSHRLWQYPRMISREGRASGIYLLAASQNPTAQNISIDLRRNCTPVAFRLGDNAASQIVIGSPEATGLETGHFIVRLGANVRGIGYNPSDQDILSALRNIKNPGRPEWLLDAQNAPAPEESWREKARRLYAEGMSISAIAQTVKRNYYDTQAAVQAKKS